MTTYGRLNGVWTAGRYELNTTILRNQWGFTGIVMTDWWAKINNQSGTKGVGNDFASMVRAQNDIYMVCPQGDENRTDDNTLKELAAGTLTRGELQRSAANICRQLMSLPAFARLNGETETVEILHKPEDKSDFDMENIVYYTFDEKGEIQWMESIPQRAAVLYLRLMCRPVICMICVSSIPRNPGNWHRFNDDFQSECGGWCRDVQRNGRRDSDHR